MTKRKLVISLVVFTVLVVTVVSVVYAIPNRKALEGLDGVGVVVEKLGPEVEKLGLTHGDLQTAVELRLRQLNIRVLTEEERAKALGNPVLYITVNVMVLENTAVKAPMVYNITVAHHEQMMQTRKPHGFYFGSTWSEEMVGTAGTTEFIRTQVLKVVDRYANDYLAANPNKK